MSGSPTLAPGATAGLHVPREGFHRNGRVRVRVGDPDTALNRPITCGQFINHFSAPSATVSGASLGIAALIAASRSIAQIASLMRFAACIAFPYLTPSS